MEDTAAGAGAGRPMAVDQVLDLLAHGELEIEGLLPWSSNYTFLTAISHNGARGLAVYKPRSGERPLWDFPEGTLYLREVATYAVARALGWPYVPPTIVRDGPYGVGSVQLFVDAEPEEHYFTLQGRFAEDFRRLATLDYVINNADRKSGHCLLGRDGRIWAVDHGVTFHSLPKLRTVIWEFAGQPIPAAVLEDLEAYRRRLVAGNPAYRTLQHLLSEDELRALQRRIADLLRSRVFPNPDPSRRHVPWPPV